MTNNIINEIKNDINQLINECFNWEKELNKQIISALENDTNNSIRSKTETAEELLTQSLENKKRNDAFITVLNIIDRNTSENEQHATQKTLNNITDSITHIIDNTPTGDNDEITQRLNTAYKKALIELRIIITHNIILF